MNKYEIGQTVFFISNNSFVIEAIVIKFGSGFYTLKYKDTDGGVRLRESRLFGNESEAGEELRKIKSNRL